MDLQPEMRDILMRNGMQAHIVANGDGYQLAVQGHDSPMLFYNVSERQMVALTDWGTNTANKKAYDTFTSIVADDFYMPRNFVHARNANGRVAMGLHGYRTGTGEYGRDMHHPDFLGWSPRRQEDHHLRRVGGHVFYAQPPMMAERPDGRMKPGEMQSGGYGFYYKGGATQPTTPNQDVLQNLTAVITPMVSRPRSQEPAKPYNELITSNVYFSNEKWQECLSSHGIIIDPQAKMLTIQSDTVNADMVYDLKDEELKALTSNSIKDYPIAKRIEVLNNVIKDDFAESITMDMLNSKERIGINLKPEVKAALEVEREERSVMNPNASQDEGQHVKPEVLPEGVAVVDGNDLDMLNENKGWYREGKHGREVQVDEISVQPSQEKGKDGETKYTMTAVINGEAVSHEISQKQYDKFMAFDDYHRMKLFSNIFKEVDMKTRPEAHTGLGTKILSALTAGAVVTSELMHDRHHPMPEVYGERFERPAPRPFFKPGVDSPQEIAARNFEAQANREITEMRRGL